MANNKFSLYVANCREQYNNTIYTDRVAVLSVEFLKIAAQYDHVCALYRDNHRCNDNFISADGVMFDVDNTPSKKNAPDIPSELWKSPQDIREAFPEVEFYVVYSRNHEKQKGIYSPRPRFHIYFAIDKTDNAEEYTAFKNKVCAYFPEFDQNAKDRARFFFGVESPKIDFFEGNINLSEFMQSVEIKIPIEDMSEKPLTKKQPKRATSNVIHEGSRNSTLSLKAGQLLKRCGDNSEARRLFDNWCKKCEPRLSKVEEDTIFKSGQQFYHNVIKNSPTYKSPDKFESVPSFAIPTDKSYIVSPPLLADYYLERHTVIVEIDSGSPRVHEYNNGVYEFRKDFEVKAVLGAYISEFRRGLWSSSKVAEAYTSIIQTSRLFVKQEQLNSDTDIVCMNNGLLNLREWRLYPHNPTLYFTTRLDCDFTEQIPKTPIFNETSRMFCNNDSEKGNFMWQFMGVTFSNVQGYKFKKFLLTIGKRDSGKTVMKRLTEMIVGVGNYNNCDLADLEANRFAAASLQHKRLSGSNDLRAAKIPEVGKLKQLTGGDSMQAERKGEQDFNMIYTGLIWHVGNERPYFGGRQDDALYQRQILFEINHSIPDEQQDHHLLEKLLTEKQGIILKCLHAARVAIYDNDYRFDIPKSCEQSKAEHKQGNNIVTQFLDECTEPLNLQSLTIENAKLQTASKVWQSFKSWRDYVGEYKGLSRSDFEYELARVYNVEVKNVKQNQRGGNGVVGRFYPVQLNAEGRGYNHDEPYYSS